MMYEVQVTTPKGVIKFNLEKLEEIEKHLPKEYTEVKATQVKALVKNNVRPRNQNKT